MNYLKYFQNKEYELGINDCWTFIQEVFKDEHNIQLPDCPICRDDKEYSNYIHANMAVKPVKKAYKGVLVHISSKFEHIGYAINEKEYIHKCVEGTIIQKIPNKSLLYEVVK